MNAEDISPFRLIKRYLDALSFSALASVKDSSVPTIVLPEVSSATLMQLEVNFVLSDCKDVGEIIWAL